MASGSSAVHKVRPASTVTQGREAVVASPGSLPVPEFWTFGGSGATQTELARAKARCFKLRSIRATRFFYLLYAAESYSLKLRRFPKNTCRYLSFNLWAKSPRGGRHGGENRPGEMQTHFCSTCQASGVSQVCLSVRVLRFNSITCIKKITHLFPRHRDFSIGISVLT